MALLTLLRRLAPVLCGVAALLFATSARGGDVAALLDPRSLVVTFVLPWLALALTDSFGSAATTAADLVRGDPSVIPAASRRLSAARLDALGSTSLAAGMIGAMLSLIGALNTIARASGQPSQSAWVGLLAGLLLGPLYGLLLKALLYDPAAAALRAAGTGLDEALEHG